MTPEQYEKIVIALMEQNERLEYANQRLRETSPTFVANAFGTTPFKKQRRNPRTGKFMK